MLTASLLPGQPEDEEASMHDEEKAPASETGQIPPAQTQAEGTQTWINTDLYAQVSNVMPSGGVVLSPGQQPRIQENLAASEKEKKGTEDRKDTEIQKKKEPHLKLLVMDPNGSGYTTESNAQRISTPPGCPISGEGYQIIQLQPMETKPTVPTEANLSPYILPDSPQPQLFAPVADYTVVQEVDTHQSLLLNPPPPQCPPPCLPQPPLKAPMPVGYITPDLLGNVSPWNDSVNKLFFLVLGLESLTLIFDGNQNKKYNKKYIFLAHWTDECVQVFSRCLGRINEAAHHFINTSTSAKFLKSMKEPPKGNITNQTFKFLLFFQHHTWL